MRRPLTRPSARDASAPTPTLKFDVMLNDRFVCTMKVPVSNMDCIVFIGSEPCYDLTALRKYVESQRPSLTGKPFEIYPTDKPKFRN